MPKVKISKENSLDSGGSREKKEPGFVISCVPYLEIAFLSKLPTAFLHGGKNTGNTGAREKNARKGKKHGTDE